MSYVVVPQHKMTTEQQNDYSRALLARLTAAQGPVTATSPEPPRQRMDLSFNFVTDDENKKRVTKQIQADLGLLMELCSQLVEAEVPVEISYEIRDHSIIAVDFLTFTAIRDDRLRMTLSESSKARIYNLGALEELLPLLRDDVQLLVLEQMHRILQDDFVKLGLFNQLFEEFGTPLQDFVLEKPTGKRLIYTLPTTAKAFPAAQCIKFQDKAKPFDLAGWCNWVPMARAVLEYWKQTK